MEASPGIDVQKCTIGKERAPLLVIDNFVKDPDELVRRALPKHFAPGGRYFPGLRAKAPRSYQRFFLNDLQQLLLDFFQLDTTVLRFSMCHYSLVTTPPGQLVMAQRIPHFDFVKRDGLASIHYLFREAHGGTAFYRHRKTGFEYVDASRKDVYLQSLHEELQGRDAPAPGYIDGDTPLFEQINRQDGVYNRLLIYRGNSLHSGCIGRAFIPDSDPRTGRLSINSFIETGP